MHYEKENEIETEILSTQCLQQEKNITEFVLYFENGSMEWNKNKTKYTL